jgi:hypothetical protein
MDNNIKSVYKAAPLQTLQQSKSEPQFEIRVNPLHPDCVIVTINGEGPEEVEGFEFSVPIGKGGFHPVIRKIMRVELVPDKNSM